MLESLTVALQDGSGDRGKLASSCRNGRATESSRRHATCRRSLALRCLHLDHAVCRAAGG